MTEATMFNNEHHLIHTERSNAAWNLAWEKADLSCQSLPWADDHITLPENTL